MLNFNWQEVGIKNAETDCVILIHLKTANWNCLKHENVMFTRPKHLCVQIENV